MSADQVYSLLDDAYVRATALGAEPGTVRAFRRAYRALDDGDRKPALLLIHANGVAI